MTWRRQDLPSDRENIGRFLPWLVAFMVYLSILALAGLMALEEMARHWDHGVSGTLTVQIPPGETANDNARLIGAVLEVLAGKSGIVSVQPIPPARVAALLEPWLGPAVQSADLPLPLLIDVEVDSGVTVDTRAWTAEMNSVAPGASVDDHRTWLRRLVGLVRSVEALSAGILVLIIAVTVVAVIFTTRTGLAVHREVIEVLHLIGARDTYIANQFAVRAFGMGIRGGLLGLALAAPTIAGIGLLGSRMEEGLIPEVTFGIFHWAAFAVMPLLSAVTAMVSARLTVLRSLARMI